jgi:hypothetical protein
MNTDFKLKSPTMVLSFSSLLLLTVGGPALWVGASAANSTSVEMWAYPTMYAGFGISALGYVLFLLTLLSAFVTIILRAKRSAGIDAKVLTRRCQNPES